jgi:hypothetical protein
MLTNEQQDVIAKVQKLLSLAGNNTNEHEAQAATQKAMDLLSAYNLSMHQIGGKPTDNKRQDKKRKGGLYAWQRDLWKEVATLNFCMYWSIKGLERGSSYEHRVLGSEVNVVSTEVMADYLQQAIERLAQAWAKEQGYKSVFVREAIAYREGMALGVQTRLAKKRADRDAEEQARRDAEPKGDGRGLILADVANSEADYNTDYVNGLEPGTTARQRAEQAARQAAATAAYYERMEAEKNLRANNPEYDAQCKAKEEANKKYWDDLTEKSKGKAYKADNRRAKRANTPGYDSLGYKIVYRAETAQEARQNLSTFGAGYRDAAAINLDKQVDTEAKKRIK